MIHRLRAAVDELVRSRHVLAQFFLRDFRQRHSHTHLGILWSVLNPLIQLVVISAVFAKMTRLDSVDLRLYAFAGMLPWLLIQSSWLVGSGSYMDNQPILKRAYVPRIVFPLARVLIRLLDYFAGLVIFTLLALALGYRFSLAILALPLAILLLAIFSLGASIIAGITAIYVRDLLHLQTVFLQLLFLATPIMYPPESLPDSMQTLTKLNPIYVMIRPFQTILFHGRWPQLGEWIETTMLSLATLCFGLMLLRRAKNDVVLHV